MIAALQRGSANSLKGALWKFAELLEMYAQGGSGKHMYWAAKVQFPLSMVTCSTAAHISPRSAFTCSIEFASPSISQPQVVAVAKPRYANVLRDPTETRCVK